jgi:HK97 family phage portal protein
MKPAKPQDFGTPSGSPRPSRYPVSAVHRGVGGYHDGWDLDRAVTHGMNRSITVFRCVQAIAGNQSKLPMVLRKGDWFTGRIVKSDTGVLDLLNVQANPGEIGYGFRKRLSQILLLNRQGVFVEVWRNRRGEPLGFAILPPGRCHPIPDPEKFVKGYRVWWPSGGFVDLPPEDVIWIRDPHPTDPYAGLTPMEAAGLAVELDWWTRLYNRNFLANDMRPGGLVVIKGRMSPQDSKDLNARLNGIGPGFASAGRTVAVEAEGADWVDMSSQPRDGHYQSLDRLTRESIMEAFGVPETILGNASGRTFANADAEREMFWLETMLPHLTLIARFFDAIVDDDPAKVLGFDFAQVPVLMRAQREELERQRAETAAGVRSIDEYRANTEDLKPVGGTMLYVGAGMTPVVDTAKPFEPLPTPDMGAPEEGFGEEPAPEGEDPAATAPETGADGGSAPQGRNAPAGAPAGAQPAEDPWADLFDGSKALPGGGAMLSLTVPAEVAERIALPGWELPASLHVTVALAGPTQRERIEAATAVFAAGCKPLTVTLAGLGMFAAGHNGKRVLWATVDSPGLAELHTRLTAALKAAGIPTKTDHGYTPHVTLAYFDGSPPTLDTDRVAGQRWTANHLTLTMDGHTIDYSLDGGRVEMKTVRPRLYGPIQPANLAAPVQWWGPDGGAPLSDD